MRYLVNNGRVLRPVGLVNELDRMLDSFLTDTSWWESQTPRVDIVKEEGQYVLSAELPGFSEENVDIKVEGNLLTITAEKQEEVREGENRFLVRERSSSSVQRSFVLPKDVDSEQIEGAFKNGVLTLTMKLAEKAQPKTITIKKND